MPTHASGSLAGSRGIQNDSDKTKGKTMSIDDLRRRIRRVENESMPQAQPEPTPVKIIIFADRPLKANEIYYRDAIQQIKAKGNQDGQRD
jgi:hypothetical protein